MGLTNGLRYDYDSYIRFFAKKQGEIFMNKKSALFKLIILGIIIAAIGYIPSNGNFIYGYGSSSVGDGLSDGGSSSPMQNCTGTRPNAPILYQPGSTLLPRATGAGEVRLNWIKVPDASSYGVGFGVESGKYIYGLPSVGDTNNFTVRFLVPGKKYFFVVRANNGCTPGLWSKEWSMVIGGSGGVSVANTNSNRRVTTRSVITPSPLIRRVVTIPVQQTVPTSIPTSIPVVTQQTTVPTVPVVTPTPQGGIFQGVQNFFSKMFGG